MLERIRLVRNRDKCQANEPSRVPCSRAILLTSRTNVPVSRRCVPLIVQGRQVTNTCYCFITYMPAYFQIPIHSSSVPTRGRGGKPVHLPGPGDPEEGPGRAGPGRATLPAQVSVFLGSIINCRLYKLTLQTTLQLTVFRI